MHQTNRALEMRSTHSLGNTGKLVACYNGTLDYNCQDLAATSLIVSCLKNRGTLVLHMFNPIKTTTPR